MLSPRRVPPALTIWLAATGAAMAQETPVARPPWTTLADASPLLWGLVLIATIIAATLLVQLVFVLRRNRMAPQKFIDALRNTILGGNYQEAWETCHRWGQTSLGRMLQPALERIGQGRERVEARFTEEQQRERQHLDRLQWAMLGVAGVVVLLCIAGVAMRLHAIGASSMAADGPRAATLAWGDAAMFAAFAIAVAVPVTVAWSWFRSQSALLLREAGEQGLQLVAALPYEDIEGVRIGRDFHAGTLLGGDADLGQTGRLQVSKELTTQCPTCNGPINSSRTTCPHCGQLLAWS
jgi:hypothetical protein